MVQLELLELDEDIDRIFNYRRKRRIGCAVADKIRLRASVNEWISESLPKHRKYIRHSDPEYIESTSLWKVNLNASGCSALIGTVMVSSDATIVKATNPEQIVRKLKEVLSPTSSHIQYPDEIVGDSYRFIKGDGIKGVKKFANREIDLLLTDPPYGISKPYTCEQQVPRRLRNDGRDFIMPRGNFGDWDNIDPEMWLSVVLPKVGGWAISFCGQAQIGEYQKILNDHKFVAVGAMVWQKTNPVPFNHRFKPINAWEAIVIGKRPGVKFNGRVVHNVFRHKSPSPQKRVHPTQKPLDLMEYFIGLFTDPGDFVFDPFGGGATTLIAASRNGRKVVSYERETDIYQVACGRIEKCLL